jgi:hypothetical protein
VLSQVLTPQLDLGLLAEIVKAPHPACVQFCGDPRDELPLRASERQRDIPPPPRPSAGRVAAPT